MMQSIFPAGSLLPMVCISGFSPKSHRILGGPPGLHRHASFPEGPLVKTQENGIKTMAAYEWISFRNGLPCASCLGT
jgi:hypothetical protein